MSTTTDKPLPAAAGSHQPCEIQDYYAAKGYLVMASDRPLQPGPLERNDWNEEDMCEYRWAVVADSSAKELLGQNAALGFDNAIDPKFRHFYRVVALD